MALLRDVRVMWPPNASSRRGPNTGARAGPNAAQGDEDDCGGGAGADAGRAPVEAVVDGANDGRGRRRVGLAWRSRAGAPIRGGIDRAGHGGGYGKGGGGERAGDGAGETAGR